MQAPLPQTHGNLPRGFSRGLFFWVLFSCVAVALRGVRWEETYENALIISRLVPYPDGHPVFQFFRNLFSAQAYLSAALVRLFPAPLPINAARNVAYLVFTTVPVYLLGAVLARRVPAGHAAVVFVLLGAYLNLDSYYPLNTWPTFYSNGHIGLGWAMVALGLLVARCWRTAYLMTGLLACVHLGHLPVLLLVALTRVAVLWRQDERGAAGRAVTWGAAGLAVSALLWLIHALFFKVAPPESGPYAVTGDAMAILRNYLPLHGVHRGFPRFGPFERSVIATGTVALLCGGAALVREEDRERYAWPAFYVFLVAVVVFGTQGLRVALGDNLPYVFLRWMPYRLTNHAAMLLVPVACALLWRRPAAWILFWTMVCAALLPVLKPALPETLYARYAAPEEWLPYVLAGGAWAALFPTLRLKRLYGLVTLAGLGMLSAYTDYGAACVLAGLASGLVLDVFARHLARPLAAGTWSPMTVGAGGIAPTGRLTPLHNDTPSTAFGRGLALLSLVVLVTMLYQQGHTREHLPRTAIQRAVKACLERSGEVDAMVLTPYWDIEWLCRTGHPVMADYQTAHHMTYLPYLAPALKTMHEELYGFDVEYPGDGHDLAWPRFSLEDWTRLSAKYGFRYVVAPHAYTLALPPVLSSGGSTLYRVPPVLSPGQ